MTETGQNTEETDGIALIQGLIAAAEPEPDIGEADPFELKCARFAQNDYGNGQRLLARYGKDLMFVKNVGWHAWVKGHPSAKGGTHWSAEDGERVAIILAQETAKAIMTEAKHLKAALIADEHYRQGIGKPDKKDGEDKRVARLQAWALKSGDIGKSRAILDAAQPYLSVKVDDLDADPFLFNVANGTLHLKEIGKDGKAVVLKKHNRADRITRLSPAVYDPKAERPIWDNFVATILPVLPEDDGRAVLADFTKVFYGHAISGDVSTRKMLMALGESGTNGKSTMVGAIADTMGDYAMSIPVATLLEGDFAKSGADASPDLARLPGARLVRTAEPKKGARLSVPLVKQLTGGTDVMTVRHLNKGFFDFIPTFKFSMSMNDVPIIPAADPAIWKRIALVRFDVEIPDEDIDVHLPEKLRAEMSGILNWLVEGFRDWLANGIVLPEAVKAAVEEHRGESDKVGNFIKAAILPTKGKSTRAGILLAAFTRWCKLSGEDPISGTAFGKAMLAHGFHRDKIGVVFYTDCELHPDWTDNTGPALDAPDHQDDGRA
jgi:putative DNA primase/helicase